MDHTRTANQCRDKWYVLSRSLGIFSEFIYRVDALAPRLQNDGKKRRWSYADTRILVDKYVFGLRFQLNSPSFPE
jgi:hypothetical protein